MPGVLDEVETFLRNTDNVANPVEDIVKGVENVGSDVIHSEVVQYAARLPASQVENALAAGNELSSIAKFANGLNAVSAVVTLVQVKHWLENLTTRLPPIIGKPLYRIVRDMVFPLETMISESAGSVANNSRQLIDKHVHFTGWAAEQSGLLAKLYQYGFNQAPTAPGQLGPTPQNLAISQLQGQINLLQQQVNRLNYELSIAERPVQVTITYGDQVKELQKEVQALRRDIVTLDDKIERLTAPIPTIQGDVATLQHELGGLRTIQVGWTDVVERIQTLETHMSTTLATLEPRVNHQERQIAQLTPLALLLQPGIQGLRTLRQLEDTPCLCPRLPDIDQAAVDALSLMLFVENG